MPASYAKKIARSWSAGGRDHPLNSVPMSEARTVDLRVDARWIVPVEPPGALEGHALVVDGGRIVAIARRDDAERDYAPRNSVMAACVCALTSPGIRM